MKTLSFYFWSFYQRILVISMVDVLKKWGFYGKISTPRSQREIFT